MSSSTSEIRVAPHTRGRLQADFACDPAGKCYLKKQFASYPFHVCRVQYLDPDLPNFATLYIQSSAGGIHAGDRLKLEISTEAGACAHVTTQASTLVYRMPDGEARQQVHLSGGPGSLLEYVPDPTILFPEGRLHSALTLQLAPDAFIIAGDSFLSHDPAGTGRPFGFYSGETRIVGGDGRLRCLDRYRTEGAAWFAGTTGVNNVGRMQGTIIGAGDVVAPEMLLAALRDVLSNTPPTVYGAASTLPNDCGVWARLLAAEGAELTETMTRLWSALRSTVTGCQPAQRRK